MPASARLRHLLSRYRELAALAPRPKPAAAYANWVRVNWEMWRQPDVVRARPLKLTFDPVNACQLSCPLCPTGLRLQDRRRTSASLELFTRLMDELGDYLFFVDFYNWGEPLLHPDLEAMIALAAKRRVLSAVSTNLSLRLDDDRIRRLLESGLSELICSIDGASAATYSRYRRNGDFELAFANLARLSRMKRELGLALPMITWRFYVFRFNEHEIDRARELARQTGVDRIVFGTPYLDDGRYPLDEAERRDMTSWSSTIAAFDRSHPTHPDYVAPGTRAKRHPRCDWHYASAAVNPDGGVAPCCAVYEKGHDFATLGASGESGNYMGAVNTEPFRQIRARFAGRSDTPTGTICERCPTPDIMSYARILNRQIAAMTVAQLARALRRWFRGPGRLPAAASASRV